MDRRSRPQGPWSAYRATKPRHSRKLEHDRLVEEGRLERGSGTAPWSFGLPTLSDRLAVYDTFRKYIQHEDGLINQRLSWMLTIHGFLYASYGLVLTKQADIVTNLALALGKGATTTTTLGAAYLSAVHMEYLTLFVFRLGISFVGLGVSAFGLISVRAAVRSIKGVARIFRVQAWIIGFAIKRDSEDQDRRRHGFEENAGPKVYLTDEGILLPRMSGGTDRATARWGSRAAQGIPIVLMSVWLLSMAVAVVQALYFSWFPTAGPLLPLPPLPPWVPLP